MKIKKLATDDSDFPHKLKWIPDAPQELFVLGSNLPELLARPAVTIVGSRKVTAYGKGVTIKLSGELARAGVLVVSGLAIGVDGIAHQAALDAGGLTLAVLPGSVEEVYPACHQNLARRILQQGGALVSEYPAGTQTWPGNFVLRNRIASGLGDVLLITEAAENSGSLHTAKFALEQGKTVLAVPGNITSSTSVGTNLLIKQGAKLVTCAEDVLKALGIKSGSKVSKTKTAAPQGDTPEEQKILDLIATGTINGDEILAVSQLQISQFNQTLTMLEIAGKIQNLGNNQWSL